MNNSEILNKITIEEYLNIPTTRNGEQVIPTNLNPEEQIDYLIQTDFNLLRSKESKMWRMEHLYYIMNKKSQKVLFTFNKAQRHFVENYVLKGYRKIIILKARQLGFTTLTALWFLDEIIFNPNTEALQIAHTLKDAGELFNRKIAYAVRNLPKPLVEILDLNQNRANKVQFSYPDGSISAISVSNSGRSGTFSLLHISELAKLAKLYPQRADEVVTGTIPSVPATNSLIIIESTAEGVTGLFYDKFMSSWKRKDNIKPVNTVAEFYPVFYNWRFDEEQIREVCADGIIDIKDMEEGEIDWAQYQEEWGLSDEELTFYYTKWIGAERDINKLNQEFPTDPMEAFISTGANFFSSRKIFKELERDVIGSVYDWTGTDFVPRGTQYSISNENFEGLIIYEDPVPGRHYVIGGDVAEGLLSGDYSVATVLGYDKLPKAVYRGHIEPDEYAELVIKLGHKYNTAVLGVEFNKDGNWVNTELARQQYPNLYYREEFDKITQTMTKKYGWLTDRKTRDVALGEFKTFFNKAVEFPYHLILSEMVSFVRDKRGKPQAQLGKHDDLILATAIAYGMLANRKEVDTPVKVSSWHSILFK